LALKVKEKSLGVISDSKGGQILFFTQETLQKSSLFKPETNLLSQVDLTTVCHALFTGRPLKSMNRLQFI